MLYPTWSVIAAAHTISSAIFSPGHRKLAHMLDADRVRPGSEDCTSLICRIRKRFPACSPRSLCPWALSIRRFCLGDDGGRVRILPCYVTAADAISSRASSVSIPGVRSGSCQDRFRGSEALRPMSSVGSHHWSKTGRRSPDRRRLTGELLTGELRAPRDPCWRFLPGSLSGAGGQPCRADARSIAESGESEGPKRQWLENGQWLENVRKTRWICRKRAELGY